MPVTNEKDLAALIAELIRKTYPRPPEGKRPAPGEFSYDGIADDLGISKPQVLGVLKRGTGVGPLFERRIADRFFEGSIDRLHNAARERAAAMPEAPRAIDRAIATAAQYDVTEAQIARVLTHYPESQHSDEDAQWWLTKFFDEQAQERKRKAREKVAKRTAKSRERADASKRRQTVAVGERRIKTKKRATLEDSQAKAKADVRPDGAHHEKKRGA